MLAVILSDVDIRLLLERRRLVIEPLSYDTIRENGVDLRLGTQFCIIRESSEPIDVDAADASGIYECTDVGEGGEFTVPPHSRVLAHTKEYIRMPDDVAGLVNLRSTLARLGLAVPPTVVDAGFEGQLTIELIGSVAPVKLRAGMRFIHLVLLRTSTPVGRPYRGRYFGQRGVTPAKLGWEAWR